MVFSVVMSIDFSSFFSKWSFQLNVRNFTRYTHVRTHMYDKWTISTITLPHGRNTKCHWPWIFFLFHFAKKKKSICAIEMLSSMNSLRSIPFNINLISIFLLSFSKRTMQNQNSNEINLNSNTVLSLFIFKQPSGSKTKLKI